MAIYKVTVLSSARQEMHDIAKYIRTEFDNPTAAKRIMKKFKEASARLKQQPYSCPVHLSEKPLEYEYRKLIVDNYIMFYQIDENKKLVTISRVIYSRRDYNQLLT